MADYEGYSDYEVKEGRNIAPIALIVVALLLLAGGWWYFTKDNGEIPDMTRQYVSLENDGGEAAYGDPTPISANLPPDIQAGALCTFAQRVDMSQSQENRKLYTKSVVDQSAAIPEVELHPDFQAPVDAARNVTVDSWELDDPAMKHLIAVCGM